jgi:hypothetical protein
VQYCANKNQAMILYHSLTPGQNVLLGTCMPQLERSDQRGYEGLIRFSRPQSLDLHVIAQHQLLGVAMEVHLLVHPVENRVPIQVVLEQRLGHD